MAAFWPRPYLVRPAPEIATRFAHAWFARPHVWYIPSPGDHDYPGQQRLYEAQLVLAILAEIHDAARASPPEGVGLTESRDAARAFVDFAPLTSETFHRWFTLEPLGLSHEADFDRPSVEALRAVLPTAERDVLLETPRSTWSLRSAWTAHIAHRPERERIVLTALREVVVRVRRAFPELADARCSAHGIGAVPPRASIDAMLAELGAPRESDTQLVLLAKRLDGPYGGAGDPGQATLELDVDAYERVNGRRRRSRKLGSVHVYLEEIEGAWAATRVELCREQREPLA